MQIIKQGKIPTYIERQYEEECRYCHTEYIFSESEGEIRGKDILTNCPLCKKLNVMNKMSYIGAH